MAAHICLCIVEDDLRSWVMDELVLMTWVEPPVVTSAATLAAVDPSSMSLLVVDCDRLSDGDRDALRTRSWATPVIAIGRDAQDLRCQYVLGAKLTSRELKHALRGTLFGAAPVAPRESAVG